MQLYNNDRVRFLDEVGEGVIVGFKGSFIAIVRDLNGFEVEISTNKLVKVSENLNDSLSQTFVPVYKGEDNLSKLKKQNLISTPFEKEVDLHIESLINSHKHLTNYEIVTVQLNCFRRELENAIKNKKTKRLIAIHGVGSGVLRTEIRALLNDYQSVSFKDASYRKYGYGATEVIIH